MIDNILESIFGAIANAVAEARRQQAEIAAEAERARAQFLAANQNAGGPAGGQARSAQPTRGAQARRKQSQAAEAVRPAPRAGPTVPPPAAAALELFAKRSDIVRSVVMAEVLARPIALRDPSTFPPGAAF